MKHPSVHVEDQHDSLDCGKNTSIVDKIVAKTSMFYEVATNTNIMFKYFNTYLIFKINMLTSP